MGKDDSVAQANGSQKGDFIYWVIPYIFLVLLHVVPGLTMEQPQVFPDELGYLGNARYLSGVAPLPVQSSGAVYHFGYSLFLVPAFWLFEDPNPVYKAIMVTNGLLISTFYFYSDILSCIVVKDVICSLHGKRKRIFRDRRLHGDVFSVH